MRHSENHIIRWLGLALLMAATGLAQWPASAQQTDVFNKEITPILQEKCIACHNHTTRKGGLNLETFESLLNGGKRGATLVAGKSEESLLIKFLDGSLKPQMPLGAALSAEEINAFKRWIDAGANGPAEKMPAAPVVESTANASLPALKPTAPVKAAINSLAFRQDGTTIALGRYQTVELLNASSGQITATLTGHSNEVRGLNFSPDGKQLAATGGNPSQFGEIKIWDVAAAKELRTWRGHRDNITASAFSPDGTMLATCSYDKLIKLWNVADGTEVKTLKDHTDAVLAVAFSPDGKLLASAGADRTAKIWDVATGKRLYTLSDALDAVQTLAFDPSGQLLAGAGADRIIHIWQIGQTEGKRLRSLIAHDDSINVVAFSPDGKTLASSSADKSLKLWNAATLVETHTCETQSDWVFGLAFSPDGKVLAVGRYDGTFATYDTQTGRRR
jgi:WD40 repeat protein/mono/diheme cytochrome c family protein